MFNIFLEFFQFIRVRKKLLLFLPIVLFLILFGTLLVFSEGSVVAPFIYALF